MPRGKRRQAGGKGRKANKSNQKKNAKSNKQCNKNNVKVRSVDLYTPDRINKEVRDIRLMMANGDDESAMKRINLVQQNLSKLGRSSPLMINALKCLILAQYHEWEAINLVLHEIEQLLDSDYKDEWNADSLKYVIDSCKRSGQIRYLMVFLDRALNQKQSVIPKTEDRCRQLYFAYFVNGCYLKQSSLGTQMKRTFKHNSSQYTMWIATATLANIITNNFRYDHYTKPRMGGSEKDVDSLSTELSAMDDKVLKIQQIMFERQFLANARDQDKIENFDALINVYYRILKLRKEWATFRQFIAGDLMKEQFTDKNKLKLWQLECFINLNDWKSVDALCSLLLFEGNDDAEIDNPFIDDWEIWFKWIDAQLVLYQDTADDDTVSEEFIDGITKRIHQIQRCETIRNINKFRAPFLSEIELLLKCAQFDNADIDMGRFSALIVNYVKHFAGRNSSCFDDVRKYLIRINEEENQQKLLKLVRQQLDAQNEEERCTGNLPQKQLGNVMRREMCYHQMELFFGLWMDEEEEMLIQRVQCLYKAWHDNVDKIEKQEDTDETAADGLILVAIHILVHLAATQVDKTRDYIMDAILLCQMGVERSEYNFRIRLYLLRLYCHPSIGNIYGAMHQFERLKICGVQFDSLSHLLYHDASRYGFTTKMTKNVIPFLHSEMESHRREFAAANLKRTEQCFEYNNYHKAIEFAEFSYTMTKSEMYLISQADRLMAKLVNYHNQQEQFPKMSDYLEAFVVPAHPYLKSKYFDEIRANIAKDGDSKEELKERENEKKSTPYEWDEMHWIDLNDYTTIPVYVREDKLCQHQIQIVRPLISSLSNRLTAIDGVEERKGDDETIESAKVHHIQLVVSYLGMLYISLTFDHHQHSSFMAVELDNMWHLMRCLQFVQSESISDISSALETCNDCNYHWILVHCFHSLNLQLFAENAEFESLSDDLTSVCSKYCEFAERMRSIFTKEVTTENHYAITGIHLERLWRFISVLSFTAMSMIEHWIKNGNRKEIATLVVEQYQLISKQVDQLRRTLSEVLKGIESNTTMIAITKENHAKNAETATVRLAPKELDKVLKVHSVDSLIKQKSCIGLQEQGMNKMRSQTVKVAMINMSNAIRQNSIAILTQNMMILKHLRFAV